MTSRLPFLPGLVLALLMLPFAGSSRLNNDEFTLMSAALRLVHGDVLYRDFFEFVAPVSLMLLAGAYQAFGATLLTTHVLATALAWLAAWQAARIARRLGATPAHAWAAGFVLAFGAFMHWPVYSHHWVGLPPALAAIELALAGLATAGWRGWAAAGVLTGVTGLTVQTDGAALGLALATGAIADGLLRRDARGGARHLAALAAGTAAVLGLAGAVLAGFGALGAAWADVVVWPLTAYKQAGNVNDVRFLADLPQALAASGGLAASLARGAHVLGAYALFVGTLVGLALWAGRRTVARAWTPADAGLVLLGAWAAFSAFALTRGRADYVHMGFHLAPMAIVATAWASGLARREPRRRTRALPLLALAAFALSGVLMLGNAIRKEPAVWARPLDPDAPLREAPVIRYLRAEARPGDTLAALPQGGFFYFYGPRPAVGWSLMMEPGEGYTLASEYEAFWAQVAARRPRFLVIGTSPNLMTPAALAPYTSRVPAGYRHVGDFASPQFGAAWPARVYRAD